MRLARWEERDRAWVVAAGLPVDFEKPPGGDHAEAIARAAACGVFVTLPHPGLNILLLDAAESLPAFAAVHAVELSSHNMALGAGADWTNGAYLSTDRWSVGAGCS